MFYAVAISLSYRYQTFFYVFAYAFEDFDKMTEEVDINEYEEFKKFLEAADCVNKLLAIKITYGGMACGPDWYSDIYGFDYGTLIPSD